MKHLLALSACAVLGSISPKLLMQIRSRIFTHKWLDLKNPKDLNDKINWIRFNSDISQWSVLADKYRVREYVAHKGLEKILVKLYGCWDRAEKINFSLLPNSFVLKTNNGCGTNLIVKDKSLLDIEETIILLNRWLKSKPWIIAAERHYKNISPVIIAEEYLENQSNFSISLVDYKFYCLNGEPASLLVCYNRKTDGHSKKIIYDMGWNVHEEYIKNKNDIEYPLPDKPVLFEEMKNICRILSEPFPFLRVDLYEIEGKIYFGELTFTPSGSLITSQTENFILELGDKLRI